MAASAAMAAALKKAAVYVATDKKALKVICGIVCGIIVIIVMPIAALLGIFCGNIEFDIDRLHEMIQADNTAAGEKWSEVESAMTEAGYDHMSICEAQLLFTYALYDHVSDDDFAGRFVSCFAAEQTDEELIGAVNTEFRTEIAVEDFTNSMASMRSTHIKVDDYVDPTTKNNLDLVKWAVFAAEKGWGYVYGTYGAVLNESLLESKATQYPDEVGANREFIEEAWMGKRVVDCVGLIKGYSWYDVNSQNIIYVTNGMADVGTDSLYNDATEKGTIDTIPEIPGIAVWHQGHIGVYIGNGEVVHAINTEAGVTREEIGNTPWTHWLKIPNIQYVEPEGEEQ